MSAPVVVFAVGNPSRGDDAIGPVLCGRLAKWLENEDFTDHFEVIEDFQLQIEHAMDLQGRKLALFIDAGENMSTSFVFERIFASTAVAYTTHELPPEAVLQVYRQTEGAEPPPAFVLCVRGESFELGEPLTAAAARHVEAALDLLMALCRRPVLAEWECAVTTIGQTSIS